MARLVHMLRDDDLEVMFQVTCLHTSRFFVISLVIICSSIG